MRPDEWRVLTPQDWGLVVQAHNESHAGETVQAPTWDEFQELKAKYGH